MTLKDGTHPAIQFPSAGHSGIKINLDKPIELTENGSVMTLDFDIGRSFVMRGNSASERLQLQAGHPRRCGTSPAAWLDRFAPPAPPVQRFRMQPSRS